MKVCVAGLSGYIGQNLKSRFEQQGHVVAGIPRALLAGEQAALSAFLANADAVINLAGAPILRRWNARGKQLIYSSRVDSSIALTAALVSLPDAVRPNVLISVSATGIYRSGATHDENSTDFDPGFAAAVVKDWEKASLPASHKMRRVVFRIGVVLGKNSQTITKLLPVFTSGLGGPIGNGRQPFPFVHIDDLTAAFDLALNDSSTTGTYNLVAPEPVSNRQFTRSLARRLNRPALFPVPAFAVKLALGQAASMLLEGATVVPKRLTDAGFRFRYPNIDSALDEIVSGKRSPDE